MKGTHLDESSGRLAHGRGMHEQVLKKSLHREVSIAIEGRVIPELHFKDVQKGALFTRHNPGTPRRTFPGRGRSE